MKRQIGGGVELSSSEAVGDSHEVYYFRFRTYSQSTDGTSITPLPKNSLIVENLS
jgi:hypothetical protein